MAATKENPIVFYDLGDAKGSPWSPNPYKTRLCLNYKGLPYRVEYISLPDVETRVKELGVGPTSDTFPRYTVPVIADPSSDPNGKPTLIADSFKIAVYLDEKYPAPQYPAIFSSGTKGIQKLFVDQLIPIAASSLFPVIHPSVPRILEPRSIEYIQRTRGAEKLKPLSDEEVAKKWQETREKFEAISKSLGFNSEAGPFILGNQAGFADFALGGLFHMVEKVDPALLGEMLEWGDGKWGKYWKDIQVIENKSTQVA